MIPNPSVNTEFVTPKRGREKSDQGDTFKDGVCAIYKGGALSPFLVRTTKDVYGLCIVLSEAGKNDLTFEKTYYTSPITNTKPSPINNFIID